MKWYRVAQQDPELRLECLCADDFGGNDRSLAEEYEKTREKHQILDSEARKIGIQSSVIDSDDSRSRHSDAYLYFPLSRLNEAAKLLEKIGLPGDILDVPYGFPQDEAEKIGREHGWTIQTGYQRS